MQEVKLEYKYLSTLNKIICTQQHLPTSPNNNNMAKFNKILKEDVSLLLKEDGGVGGTGGQGSVGGADGESGKDGTYVTKSLT